MAAIVVKEDATFCSNRRQVLKSAFKSQTGNNSFRLDGIKKKATEARFTVKNS